MGIFGRSLSFQMAVATFLGILCGLFLGDLTSILGPWANAYIMILKVTAVPYLMVAIIHGVGQMTDSQGKQILKKGFFFICLAWIINISIIYLMAFLFPHPKLSHQIGSFSTEKTSINFAELLIPDNIFYDLSNNVIPAVVIFSLFIGLALMHIKEKHGAMSLLEIAVSILTRITIWISRITPIGTFLIIAHQVGTIHFSTVKQIGTYIILYVLGICIVTFWIFPQILALLTPMRPLKWLKDMLPILILAYTTNMVIVCLPYIIQLIQNETQLLLPKDEKAQMPTQGIVSIIFNLPLASLFISFFVIFAALFYQHPLGLKGHIELLATTFLSGLGSIGIGSWINSLTFLFDSLGMPMEGINLYLSTLPFTAGFQSMVSAMELSSLSFLIILACRNMIHFKWPQFIKTSVFTLTPLILLVIGIKAWNFLPQIHNPTKGIEELDISCEVNITVRSIHDPVSIDLNEDTFSRILRTKILRVGYYPCIPPFCFYNKNGNIVGYDIAFACELAHDLGCSLELVPLTYNHLKEELNAGLYDIGMSAISFTNDRLKNLCFTAPYIEGKIVFVTHTKSRKSFIKLPLKPDLKVAALRGTSFEPLAQHLFPNQEIVLLDDYEDFLKMPEDTALLWEEQEAISWVINHPYFTVAYPDPTLGIDSFGYPIKANSVRFLNYLNRWLELKQSEGFSEQEYDLWILRKTDTSPPAPRWSIYRDVIKTAFFSRP